MTASSSQYGTDALDPTYGLYTGSGDDNIRYWGQGWVYSGAGNDTVSAGVEGLGVLALIDGGAGNDDLTIGFYGGKALGGAGNDRISVRMGVYETGTAEMIGGAGHDTFVFDRWADRGQLLIGDFTLNGPDSDTLVLGSPGDKSG
ncbi:MAG: hypothetical protein EOO54_28925, partial [Haliea sp.]